MATMTLEFQGVRSNDLLWWLLVGIAAVLVSYGVSRLIRQRWRDGLICLTALFPPAAATVLLIDAVARRARGEARAARSSLLGAVAIAAGVVLVGGVFLGTGGFGLAVWMVIVALEVAVAVGVFYAAVYAYLGTRRMAALMAMRCAAILALLLILFKPAVSVLPDSDAFRVRLPILLDRSGSMDTTDQSSVANRYTQAVHVLGTQRERIERHFRPVWSHFAKELRTVESWRHLGQLEPRGEGTDGTNLARAVRDAVEGEDLRDVAGILLLSDGVHNAADDLKDAVISAGVPVYTVGLGSDSETETGRRNVQLLSAEAPFEVIKNNLTTLTVRVKAVGFKNISGEIQVFEEGGAEPVATAPLWTDKNVTVIKKELKWTPRDRAPSAATAPDAEDPARTRSDVRKLRIAVPANPADTVTQDNECELHVLVTEPRIRVLYVEGSIRPEYKFLWRTLNTDQNVQLMSLIRIRENRFSSYGSIAGRKLLDLPRTEEDFRMFDVMILGDLDSTFLTREQMRRLKQFVKDGGGLLMMGGHNSFGPGGYGGSDVEAVLPVVVGNRSQPQETTPFLPQLTAFGLEHPVFEGMAKYFHGPEGKKPTEQEVKLEPLLGCVTAVHPQPAATVLAVHPTRKNEYGPLIVLAVQPYGAGRSAAFTADTTWQWYLPLRGMGADSPYRLFWGQLIRWLANVETKAKTAASAVVGRVDSSYVQMGRSVRILAHVQDDRGRPADSARVSVTVEPVKPDPRIEPETLPMTSKRSGGMFETNFRPLAEGRYRVRLTAADPAGQSLGSDELTVTVAPQSAEMDRLARDVATLRMVADSSDGRYTDVSGLPELLDQIEERQTARGRAPAAPKVWPYYDDGVQFTLLFLLFVALMTAEWLVRRSWQLH